MGVTVGLASSTQKSDAGITTPVIDKDGNNLKITPAQFYNAVVGIPAQYTLKNKKNYYKVW